MAQQVPMRRGKTLKTLRRIRLDEIEANRAQPRQIFDEEGIEELAQSIRRYGLLSPPLVREAEFGYELIAGERRLRALKKLGAEEIDVIVMNADDRESALVALIENLQRENLTFFEEAEAYRALIGEYGMTRDELAARVGRSASSVANRLRLLKLGTSVRTVIQEGGLTERHARALVRLEGEEEQLEAANKAVRMQMTVRALEQTVERMLTQKRTLTQRVQGVYRDHRLFLNTMLNTVRTLQTSGVDVTSRVRELPEGVEITVLIPKAAPKGRGA